MRYKLMNKKNLILIVVFVAIITAMGFQTYQDSIKIVFLEESLATKNIVTDPDLEIRLQTEIDANQKMAQIVTDVISACNEKLFDKYNNTNERLANENRILQDALSKIRES